MPKLLACNDRTEDRKDLGTGTKGTTRTNSEKLKRRNGETEKRRKRTKGLGDLGTELRKVETGKEKLKVES
jgi:hypothetical protein